MLLLNIDFLPLYYGLWANVCINIKKPSINQMHSFIYITTNSTLLCCCCCAMPVSLSAAGPHFCVFAFNTQTLQLKSFCAHLILISTILYMFIFYSAVRHDCYLLFSLNIFCYQCCYFCTQKKKLYSCVEVEHKNAMRD
jgi:hypothetical protein